MSDAPSIAKDDTPKREKRESGSGCLIPPRPGVTQFWTVQVRDVNGKLIRRSTKVRGELKPRGDPKNLKDWTNITAARESLEDLLKKTQTSAITADSDPAKLHYGDLRKLYLQDYADQGNRSLLTNTETGEAYVCGLKHLDAFFGYEKPGDDGRKVNAITIGEIARFKAERKRAGAENGTINRSLAALRRMFRLAIEKAKLQLAPPVKMLPEPKQPRQGFLEIAEYEKLLKALPEYVRAVVAVGYYTGMRLGEILNLGWHQVSIGEKIIRLESEDTKNAEFRIIPLIDGLPELLEDIRRKNSDAEYVFLGEGGKPIGSFIKAWRNACIRAGIRTKLNGQEVVSHFEGKKYIGFLFHDLRRSAVRNLVRAGVPRSVARAISGHKTEEVFERYNITSEDDLQDAAASVTEYLNKKRAEAKKAPSPMKKRLQIASAD